jgi:hypothetical protein
MMTNMVEELRIHRVEVSFVGTPPTRQVERASGVSEVAVEGSTLRCLVCGSFQPFIEALGGHEVVDLTSVPVASPALRTPPAVPRSDIRHDGSC